MADLTQGLVEDKRPQKVLFGITIATVIGDLL